MEPMECEECAVEIEVSGSPSVIGPRSGRWLCTVCAAKERPRWKAVLPRPGAMRIGRIVALSDKGRARGRVGEFPLADPDSEEGLSEQAVANLHLAAAAPEMAAALEGAIEAIEGLADQQAMSNDWFVPMLNTARAALRAARGEVTP